jgi:hypothetical protein
MNIPVGSFEEVYKETVNEIRTKRFNVKYLLKIDNLFTNIYRRLGAKYLLCSKPDYDYELFKKIFDQMYRITNQEQAELVSGLIYNKISKLPSWKQFEKHQQSIHLSIVKTQTWCF